MSWIAPVLSATATIASCASAIPVAVRRKKRWDALPEEHKTAVRTAKRARSNLKKTRSEFEKSLRSAQSELNLLTDQKGRRVASLGGVTVYERWIVTPQGSGSIIGVRAEAADETTVKSRLTATRLVALGVFALAAPKRTGAGNAYVVIEGPAVSGVATLAGKNNQSAGPAAYNFAAKINTAARKAAEDEPTRPERIEEAQSRLKAAEDTTRVDAAASTYSSAVHAVPEQYRSRFQQAGDRTRPNPEARENGLLACAAAFAILALGAGIASVQHDPAPASASSALTSTTPVTWYTTSPQPYFSTTTPSAPVTTAAALPPQPLTEAPIIVSLPLGFADSKQSTPIDATDIADVVFGAGKGGRMILDRDNWKIIAQCSHLVGGKIKVGVVKLEEARTIPGIDIANNNYQVALNCP